MAEGSEEISQSSQPTIMENISRETTRVIHVKKVLRPTGSGSDSLSDSSQSIQSEPTNVIRIIQKRTNPISFNENPFSVCYDRIIIGLF